MKTKIDITSDYPELNQPLPRRVKLAGNFYTVLGTLLFVIILISIPLWNKNVLSMPPAKLQFLCSIFAFVAGAPVCILIYNFLCYRRERAIIRWGTIAAATTTRGKEYFAGRGTHYIDITYEFKDEVGNTVSGKKAFPSRPEELLDSPRTLEDLDTPVVLYDPNNSKTHLLYPGTYAVCVLPTDGLD